MGVRNRDVHFLASEEEVERIHQKMGEMGVCSMGAYLRKMALDGCCVRLDLEDVGEHSASRPAPSRRRPAPAWRTHRL